MTVKDLLDVADAGRHGDETVQVVECEKDWEDYVEMRSNSGFLWLIEDCKVVEMGVEDNAIRISIEWPEEPSDGDE